jgi:sucrose-6-phosphate hydrolase SacC (GH32 family)
MTLPRELELKKDGEDYFISSTVIPAFDKIGSKVLEKKDLVFDKKKSIPGNFQQAELSWKQNLNQWLTIRFSNKKQEYLEVKLDPESGQMLVDRSHSGLVAFNENFAAQPHTMPFLAGDKSVDMRIILDQSSIEIFMDDGRFVMTELFFPTEPYTELTFSASGQTQLEEFTIREIGSIWKRD